MARGQVVACVLALSGFAAVGCGDSSLKPPPPSCLTVQPCGGDVVGTWAFLGACTDLAAQTAEMQASCPGGKLNSEAASLSGLLTFNADLSYTATDWHEAFAGNETRPLSCTSAATCAANSGSVTLNGTGETGKITTACSGASTCSCTVTGNLNVTADSGIYTITTTTLAMMGGPTSSTFSYCVQGNELHLMQTGTTAVLSDIVAQKQ